LSVRLLKHGHEQRAKPQAIELNKLSVTDNSIPYACKSD